MPTERELPGTHALSITCPGPTDNKAEILIDGVTPRYIRSIVVHLAAQEENRVELTMIPTSLAVVVEAKITVVDAREVLEKARNVLAVAIADYQFAPAADRLLMVDAVASIDAALREEA